MVLAPPLLNGIEKWERMQAKENEPSKRTLCSLETVFSYGRKSFTGRIENMSNSGAVVVTDQPVRMPEGENIHMTIDCDGREDVLKAQVIWSDDSAFGAKFL